MEVITRELHGNLDLEKQKHACSITDHVIVGRRICHFI